ncbi:MAG TPA: DUF445 domain-containing protein [Gemmatimonadales bacterium]|nr:DUF445 domain-containing protein [Gemmatimonadales bacterium]
MTPSAHPDMTAHPVAPAAPAAPAPPAPAGPPAAPALAAAGRSSALGARPDDAVRQTQLDAMKRRATGLLGLAAAVFGAASVLEGRYAWVGYVRATAEASLVGGLADWFAVTALFRRPLGLPIPHTAIVATRKERIGRILGTFVQNHFLSRDVIAAKLHAMGLAARAARWLSEPQNSRRVAQQVASGMAKTLEALPDAEMRQLVHQVVTSRLRAMRVAPALGKTLSLVLAGNGHQEFLNEAVRLAAQAVHDNRGLIRDQVRSESPWWVPGVVDDKIYERIVGAIERLLRDIGADPTHPLRAAFDTALQDFVHRLEHSPDVIARAEALKEEWLAEPGAADLAARLWETTRRAVVAYATQAGGQPPGPLERGISTFGAALAANSVLLAELDDLVTDLTVAVVEQYRQEIGDFIALTVAGWDPAATSRRFELAVGRDLQFVRINGTLVGGLVGLAIYTIWHLWH